MKVYKDLLEPIISVENLFLAWDEFRRGKQNKIDVMKFEWRLEENIFDLHRELKSDRYKHGAYRAFYIQDPKQRLVHKATVRDRILHHAISNILNPIFEPTFIANSFSCRGGKGTHKGVKVLARILRKVSRNHTSPCFALKCDVFKFFASVDHAVLNRILEKRIGDKAALELVGKVIGSFNTKGTSGKGLPIGNLTSQLSANIYMNELDQFLKHELKVKNYVRYTDDFIIVGNDVQYLKDLLPKIEQFLEDYLALKVHPRKIITRKFTQGVDFLGYIIFPHHILLRTKTRRRLVRKLSERSDQYAAGKVTAESFNQTWQSYLGVLSHAHSYKLAEKLKSEIKFETSS